MMEHKETSPTISRRPIFKYQKVVTAMVTSLVSEGYMIQCSYESLVYTFYKLWHSHNGSEIQLAVWPTRNYFRLTRDGKVRKQGHLVGEGASEVHQS